MSTRTSTTKNSRKSKLSKPPKIEKKISMFNTLSPYSLKCILDYFNLNDYIMFKSLNKRIKTFILSNKFFKEYISILKKKKKSKPTGEKVNFYYAAEFIMKLKPPNFTEEEREILQLNYLHFFFSRVEQVFFSELKDGSTCSILCKYLSSPLCNITNFRLLKKFSNGNYLRLAEALKKNTSIRIFTLDKSDFEISIFKQFSEIFTVNKHMTDLVLYQIKSFTIDKFEKVLYDIGTNKNLTSFTFEGIWIDIAHSETLKKYLIEINTLEKLNLTNNKMMDQSIINVISGIRGNKSIQNLKFCNNKLKDYTVNLLVRSLIDRVNDDYPIINQLSISGNRLADTQSSSYIGQLLDSGYELESLDLSNTTLFEFVKAVSQAMISNQYLKELNLSNNHLGNRGALVLASGLKYNKSLISVKLQDNGIDHKIIEFIKDQLKERDIKITN